MRKFYKWLAWLAYGPKPDPLPDALDAAMGGVPLHWYKDTPHL